MTRGSVIIAAILFGIGFVLELIGIPTYRYGFLFAGLLAFVMGHVV